MGLFSLEKLFGITIRESATDGSDFTNPDADYRRLFLGEDGQLHVKDSAGSVTDIGAASGSVATDAIWDAAGDLAVGSGANTAAKLTVGSTGDILNVAAGTAAWTAPGTLWAPAAFTPTLTADGGNPNLGSTGSAAGRYIQIGKFVFAYGKIEFKGTGVTAGTGVYEILLPATASASSLIGTMGSVILYDDSAGLFTVAVAYPLDTGEFRIAVGSTSLIVQDTVPWTWAANDQIHFALTYESA